MSSEQPTALERIRAADASLADARPDAAADARIRGRLHDARRRPGLDRWRWSALVGALAAAAALVVGVWGPGPPPCDGDPVSAPCVSSWRESAVTLDAGTRIRTGDDGITLLEGRARFDVQPRPAGAPPYVVRAAGARIEVLGTAFTVTVDDHGGAVQLHHGRVALATPDGGEVVLSGAEQHAAWRRSLGRGPVAPAAPTPSETSAPTEPTPRDGGTAAHEPTHPRAADRRSPTTDGKARRRRAAAARPATAPPARAVVTEAELTRVAALRRDGHPEQALRLVEALLRRPLDDPTAEALGVERGDLLGGPLGRTAAACAHWRAHRLRHPDGALRAAAEASFGRLRCPPDPTPSH